MKILLTGATGFVGSAFVTEAIERNWSLRAVVRHMETDLPDGSETVLIEDMGPETYWLAALEGIDAVVHLAARVHQISDKAIDPAAAYYRTNVQATKRLAEQALQAGVSRFIFLSTVKVNGEGRPTPYTEEGMPSPSDSYAVSKYISEQDLMEIAKDGQMFVTILRPPLVYGEGVKANFFSLMRIIDKGLPLPFKSIKNRRSLIYVRNLASAIAHCLTSGAAKNQTFLVSDQADVSTPELMELLAMALGRKNRLLAFPTALSLLGARLLGKGPQAERVLGTLAVDSGKLSALTGWQPPFSLREGLRRTAEWYRASKF